MNISPKVSILIANYNNGKYLEEAIKSIFNQTYNNWEIVIYDDKSTDNSIEIYQKYESHDKINIFFHEENKGCGWTKHNCVLAAQGQICGFLDPDDTLTKDALELMVNKHLEYPIASLVYSLHYFCDEQMNILNIPTHFGNLPNGKTILETDRATALATFKREAYMRTEGISLYHKRAVDKDLYYKLEEVGTVKYIDEPLYYYRKHEGGISTTNNVNNAKEWVIHTMILAFNRRGKDRKYLDEIYRHYKILQFRRGKFALKKLKMIEVLDSIWRYFLGNPFKEFSDTKSLR